MYDQVVLQFRVGKIWDSWETLKSPIVWDFPDTKARKFEEVTERIDDEDPSSEMSLGPSMTISEDIFVLWSETSK